MREIKFRAWVEEPGTDIRCFYFFKINETVPPSLSVVAWEQFTGLHDKNDKEIYEGDILKEIAPRGYIYRVFGVAGGFVINSFQDEITMLRFAEPIANMQTAGYIQEQCEIIGNIHENPELLEGRE